MADRKIFAGAVIKRLRRTAGMTQLAFAEALEISPSYLNLLERNQRPVSARIMVLLADRFDLDPRQLAAAEPGGGLAGLNRRLADPLFADLDIDRTELEEWLSVAPNAVEAFTRLFDGRMEIKSSNNQSTQDQGEQVRKEISKWRNYFADLDLKAEKLADELRMKGADPYGALVDHLRVNHQIAVRILPANVLSDMLCRLDLHARQYQLSEMLDPASRLFHIARLLGRIEARSEIDALVRGGAFEDDAARHLYRHHLESYYAGALIMPYARFLRACEQTGYHLPILMRRFGVSFEQVAHRLTTLQRVGSRGLPFFMVKIDRAGQVVKSFAGASEAVMADSSGRCPLWDIHRAFEQSTELCSQLVELEDGSRWFTLAGAARGPVAGASLSAGEFALAIGLSAETAATLYAAQGLDLETGPAASIGLGCAACTRPYCTQRSAPPRHRTLQFDSHARGVTPYGFVSD